MPADGPIRATVPNRAGDAAGEMARDVGRGADRIQDRTRGAGDETQRATGIMAGARQRVNPPTSSVDGLDRYVA